MALESKSEAVGADVEATGTGENIWEEILAESSAQRRVVDSTVLFLGSTGSGVNSLVHHLAEAAGGRSTGAEAAATAGDSHRGRRDPSALQYQLLDKRDILSDRAVASDKGMYGHLHAWTLTDARHAHLLRFALSPTGVEATAVVVAVDLSRPWTVAHDLDLWIDTATEALGNQLGSLDGEVRDTLHRKLEEYLRAYKAPAQTTRRRRTTIALRRASDGALGDLPPLREGVFVLDIGVPLVVVGTHSEHMAPSAARRWSDGEVALLQSHVRRVCLKHGAALLHMPSAPSSDDVARLYSYLLHRTDMDTFMCEEEPQTFDTRVLFLPAGLDSTKLIDDLVPAGSRLTVDTPLESVFPAPKSLVSSEEPTEAVKVLSEAEFAAEVERLSAAAMKAMASKKPSSATPAGGSRHYEVKSETSEHKDSKPGANLNVAEVDAFFQDLGKGIKKSKRKHGKKSRSSSSAKSGSGSTSSRPRRSTRSQTSKK